MNLCCQDGIPVLCLRIVLYLVDLISPHTVEDIEKKPRGSGVEPQVLCELRRS